MTGGDGEGLALGEIAVAGLGGVRCKSIKRRGDGLTGSALACFETNVQVGTWIHNRECERFTLGFGLLPVGPPVESGPFLVPTGFTGYLSRCVIEAAADCQSIRF